MKNVIFNIALMAILTFYGCSSKGERLGYESLNSTIEYESIADGADSDTVVGVEASDYNPVDMSVSEKTSNHQYLSQTFSNYKFSIRFPSNWDVVQENARATDNTTIAVQIMQREVNEYDFRPNVNIIASKDKRTESPTTLARMSYNQVKESGLPTNLIGIHDCQVNGKKGSVAEYVMTIEGYKLHLYQYIVKKKDNSTFIITVTLAQDKFKEQKALSQQIINSIEIF